MLDEFTADVFRQALLKGGVAKDFKQRIKQAKNQRKIAEEERESKKDKKGSKPTFLRPSDLAGDYDFKRALQTTLGMPDGQVRTITKHDLVAFAANIEQMAKAYKGGITVEQIISLSHQDDIDRANKQIHLSIPVGRKNSTVHFTTNASPGSDIKYHHVHVEFLAFNELVFYPDRVKSTSVQNRLSKGRVKFECDCGRFNFWYRYLNTIAGTVLGRREGGFPKIRNPNMIGVACKHVLRVMQWIKSSTGRTYLAMALEKERKKQVGTQYRTGKSEVARHISEQIIKANTKRNEIKPNLAREIKRLEASAMREARTIMKKQKELETKHQAAIKLKNLHEQGILSDAEYQLLSKRL